MSNTSDGPVMMALGRFRFALGRAAWQRLHRVAAFRWEPQDRLGRAPAVQYLGPGTATIDLEGTLYPGFGLGQIGAMRAAAGEGAPLDLVDGTGRVWGLWVITEVVETGTVFLSDGRPRKQTFQMRLTYYGEDHDG